MLELIEQALEVRYPKVLELSPDRFSVVGDIHADLTALNLILRRAVRPVIFLGDYADRGDRPADVYRTILEGYISGEFILLRGNHETQDVHPHDLPYRLEEGGHDGEVYLALRRLWDSLPVCAVVNELFLVHGGVYTKACRILDEGVSLSDLRREAAMVEMLWNDPWEKDGCDHNYERGLGFFFGRLATRRFLDDIGVRTVIRSHEPYKVLKAEQDGMVVTVGSTGVYGTRIAFLNITGKVKNGYEVVGKYGHVL
ncbi:Calcineurin-like phosphoesterase [Geoglobus ahangari]|uniref:Calcineurin-like phosphoesterase n=1 Tax=Geoglobus ahangari TaxID=113653 RepID=A0A0F7IFN5_9EURY|nr:metallophosphoesterase family protein [Geoglobus ahangari]AKG92358.1 Calcineurin-like phosphoesterase [Geoglobus ahangari]